MPTYRIKADAVWINSRLRRSDEKDPTVVLTEEQAKYLVMSGSIEPNVAPAPTTEPVAAPTGPKRAFGKPASSAASDDSTTL